MLDFFERQDIARRSTTKLLVLFTLAVCGIIVSLYLVAAGVMILQHDHGERDSFTYRLDDRAGHTATALVEVSAPPDWWQPGVFSLVALGTLALIGLGSAYKIHQLSSGAVLAQELGGRLIPTNTTDPGERRVRNVVEEMAIASGCPVPSVYVLRNESAINAFAAGYSPSDAVVGVTQGAIEKLDRDELQGVMAHEFSHILHGDMRLNLRLIGILHGILVLGLTGRMILRGVGRGSSSRSSRGGGAVALILVIGLALFVIGFIGVFFGRLIKAAVSRQREHLADAAAVQFTRNPAGLAGALKKIGGLAAGSYLLTGHAEEASHMMFGSTMGRSLFRRGGWFATHPPIPERVRRLDPAWDGRYPQVRERPATREEVAAAAKAAFGRGDRMAGAMAAAALASAQEAVPAEEVTRRVAAVSPQHVAYGRALLESIPGSLADAAHEPLGAEALAFAIVMSQDPAVRAQQLTALAASKPAARGGYGGVDLLAEVRRLLPQVDAAGDAARLPLLDLIVPALRTLSIRQYQDFTERMRQVVKAERPTGVFSYVLQKVLLVHLRRSFFPKRARARARLYSLRAVAGDAAALLSVLAWEGNDDSDLARMAFLAGLQRMKPGRTRRPLRMLGREAATLRALDGALNALADSNPAVKRRVLDACAWAVSQDGKVTVREAELLRAVADALDCPMPPFLDSEGAAA
jgi:Zn-dependent protease with chaperone function